MQRDSIVWSSRDQEARVLRRTCHAGDDKSTLPLGGTTDINTTPSTTGGGSSTSSSGSVSRPVSSRHRKVGGPSFSTRTTIRGGGIAADRSGRATIRGDQLRASVSSPAGGVQWAAEDQGSSTEITSPCQPVSIAVTAVKTEDLVLTSRLVAGDGLVAEGGASASHVREGRNKRKGRAPSLGLGAAAVRGAARKPVKPWTTMWSSWSPLINQP